MERDWRDCSDGLTAAWCRLSLFKDFLCWFQGKGQNSCETGYSDMDQRSNPHWHSCWTSTTKEFPPACTPAGHWPHLTRIPGWCSIPRQQNCPGFLFPWHLNILAFSGDCLCTALPLTEELGNIRVANMGENKGEKSRHTSKSIYLFKQALLLLLLLLYFICLTFNT